MESALLVLFFAISFNGQAQTYTTMADGNWSDPAIWSTDGGVTSCSCTPLQPTAGSNIVVKHVVDLVDRNITITGASKMTVTAYEGEIHWSGPGGGLINVQNGQLYINNYISLNQLNIAVAGNVTIVGYSEMHVKAGFDVFGTLHVLGGYLTVSSGNLKFETTADVQLTNFSKIEVAQGNLTNLGSVYIGGNCCIETKGAWENGLTGTVSGNGAAQSSNGAIKNFNIWQATVNWCGGGNPQNMPPENCAEVNNECGMLVLGVTFGEFEAFAVNKKVELLWNTVTEKNNDYFLVQRSLNGFDFETIGMVDGSGTTDEEIRYTFTDPAPHIGISYYRLEQVDLDGNSESTPLKAVEISEGNDLVVVASYNLMGQEVTGDYTGVVIDLLNDGTTRKRFVH